MDKYLFVLIINLLVFMTYSFDKLFAIKRMNRISEKVLIILSFFGSIGAIFAMNLFKHKIRKKKFYIVYLILIVHIIIFIKWGVK